MTPIDSAGGWVISCDVCEHNLTMPTFPTEQDAIVHAVTNGWTVNEAQTRCPGCAAATTRSHDQPGR